MTTDPTFPEKPHGPNGVEAARAAAGLPPVAPVPPEAANHGARIARALTVHDQAVRAAALREAADVITTSNAGGDEAVQYVAHILRERAGQVTAAAASLPCPLHPGAPAIGGMCGGCTQYPVDMLITSHRYEGTGGPCIAELAGQPCAGPMRAHALDTAPPIAGFDAPAAEPREQPGSFLTTSAYLRQHAGAESLRQEPPGMPLAAPLVTDAHTPPADPATERPAICWCGHEPEPGQEHSQCYPGMVAE